MTAYRTRGGTMSGQKMPSFTTLICDAPDCGTTPRRGDDARLLRKVARELGWTRVDGKDYCGYHTCDHGYVPGDHHYEAGTCGARADERTDHAPCIAVDCDGLEYAPHEEAGSDA